MAKLSFKISIHFFLVSFILFPAMNLSLRYFFYDSNNLNYTKSISLSNGYPDVNMSKLPNIDYDTLNDMWYNPKIEMLIITPNKTNFIDAMKPLMDWKNEKGIKTIILSNFSLYGGVDDAERIRNMIKSYYEKENVRWVLLAGDAENDLIPIRMVYNPDAKRWGEGRTETVGGEYYKPTDFYYADLNGTWDSDRDGNWGEAPQDNFFGLDEISWIPEVYVGRFPADDAIELEIMVNKTLKYEMNPQIGDWMNKMLLAGGISSYTPQEYESRLTSYIIQNYANSEINCTHLVEENGNLTSSILVDFFNNGSSTVIMAGHGLPTTYYRNPSTAGYTASDASSSTNDNMPSLVYIDACSTSSYDFNDGSIGESLIKRINGGAIGVIGGLRVTWYFENDINLEKLNRGNAKLFWKEFYHEKKFQQGRALYDSKVSYIISDYYTKGDGSLNYDFERKNVLTYCLLGDPELDIYTNKPKMAMDAFLESIYEGQLVSAIIKSIKNETIPHARVHLRTADGKYHTAYADKNGIVQFRIPAQENEVYNVTITGHNLVPSYFNFTTLADNTLPELHNIEYSPEKPSTSDKIQFNIEARDDHSGIESVFLLVSMNSFENYTYYQLKNDYQENEDTFTLSMERLKPGDYSYFVVARDYANNTNVFFSETFTFTIPERMIDHVLMVLVILVIGIVGVSAFIVYKGIKKYSRMMEDVK